MVHNIIEAEGSAGDLLDSLPRHLHLEWRNTQYTDIGIDLGTASILVYIRGKGVVLKEPSVVAFDRRDTNKIKAIGEDARLMLGRTPGNIVAVRPLRQGVISDYTVTERC